MSVIIALCGLQSRKEEGASHVIAARQENHGVLDCFSSAEEYCLSPHPPADRIDDVSEFNIPIIPRCFI